MINTLKDEKKLPEPNRIRTFRGSFSEFDETNYPVESKAPNTIKENRSNVETYLKPMDSVGRDTSNDKNIQYLSNNLDSGSPNQMFMSMDLSKKDTKSEERYYSTGKKKKSNTCLTERGLRSARAQDPLEFSFEARNTITEVESEFVEPFKLNVALPNESKRDNNLIKRSRVNKEKALHRSAVLSPEEISPMNRQRKADQFSKSYISNRSDRDEPRKMTEEGADAELNNLISNLTRRLYSIR